MKVQRKKLFRRNRLAQCLAFAFGATLMSGAFASPPVINSYFPPDNSTTFRGNRNLEISFDSLYVHATAGKNIVIKKVSDDSVVETIAANDTGKVSFNGSKTFSINPAVDLAFGTAYYITIDPGAFQNAGGENYVGITDANTWNFVTTTDSCIGGGATTISTAVTDPCLLDAGESVMVAGAGSIKYIGQYAGAVEVSGAVAGSISNSGTIEGPNAGINVGGGSTIDSISNSGTISGSGAGIIMSGSNIAGDIFNAASGVVSSAIVAGSSSAPAGILVSSSQLHGSIINSGSIGGYQGIVFANSSQLHGGIINSGSIGGHQGIVVVNSANVSGYITNSGTISGATNAIDVTDGSSQIGGIVIVGNNTAKFIGGVNTPNSPVSIADGATYTMDNGQLFTLNGTSIGFAVSGTGTLGVAESSTGTIAGNYTQAVGATFRTHATDSALYGKLVVSGSATLPAAAGFDVVFSDTTTCGGITAGGTIAGVINAGTLSVAGGSVSGAVTDNCPTLNFTAVKNGNAIDLVAVATWTVSGVSNGNGTISCTSPVINGNTATCTGTASGGYQLSGATGNGACGTVSVSGSTVTAGPITGACTVTGNFSPSTWTVTGASNGNGTVSCVSPVTNGNTATCTGTASGGYHLGSASGCGTTSISGSTITAGPVTAACTVTGTFVANPLTTYTAAAPTGSGNVTATLVGGGVNCGFGAIHEYITVATSGGGATVPSGVTFPHGLFNFNATNCTGAITITVTYPQTLPTGTKYWKYGPTSADHSNHWYEMPASIGVNTASFSITDGGLGDDDYTVNGTIVDAGGVGIGGAAAIPTFSDWGTMGLAGLMALFGMRQTRRRKGGQRR